MKLFARLTDLYDRIVSFMAVVAGVLLVFLMLSVCWEVALRDIFGRPTSWVVEIAGYILLYIPFLVAAWVLKEDGHVKMDIMLNLLSRKHQALINAITSIVSALVCLALSWFALMFTLYLFQKGYKTPTLLMVPKWILIVIIFFGCFLFFIEFLRRAAMNLKAWRAGGVV